MEDTTNTAVVDTPIIDAPAATDAPTTAPEPAKEFPKPNETLRDTIRRAIKTPPPVGKERPRDVQSGKFVPANPAAPAPQQNVVPAAPSAPVAAAPPPVVRPNMPKSLRMELQPHWEKSPQELQQAIIERESAFERGVAPLKEKAAQADRLLKQFQPYESMLKSVGSTPESAISEMLQFASIVNTGTAAQKAQALATTIRRSGVPLQHIQQFLSGQAAPQPMQNPQYNDLAQQVESLKAALDAQQIRQVNEVIKNFSARPANKYFNALEDRISAFLQYPATLGVDTSQMNEEQLLEAAYQAAIRLDPEISRQVAAEQQANAQARQQIEQSRNAAVLVHGAPESAPRAEPNRNDLRAVIKSAMRTAQR